MVTSVLLEAALPVLPLPNIWKDVRPLDSALSPKDNSRPQEEGVRLPTRRHVNDIHISTLNW